MVPPKPRPGRKPRLESAVKTKLNQLGFTQEFQKPNETVQEKPAAPVKPRAKRQSRSPAKKRQGRSASPEAQEKENEVRKQVSSLGFGRRKTQK